MTLADQIKNLSEAVDDLSAKIEGMDLIYLDNVLGAHADAMNRLAEALEGEPAKPIYPTA